LKNFYVVIPITCLMSEFWYYCYNLNASLVYITLYVHV
jgi:hypothetical protein